MFSLLAQINTDLLGVTGVIATILALIFGLGAYTNSRTRKKHMQELEKAQRQDHAMHFRPAKSHLPGRSTLPSRSTVPPHKSSAHRSTDPGTSSSPHSSSKRTSTPRAAPVAKSSTPPEEVVSPKKSEKPVLFRKVRPDGMDQQVEISPDEDKEKYLWE